MTFDFKEISTAAMVLFAVIDIIGNVPVIINIRRKSGHIASEKASLVSLIIMISFLFLGEKILSIVGVTANSFAVAGAFVLFFIALEMILGIQIYKHETPKSASLVPLAFPLIVGPGSMTTLISLKAEFETQNIVVAIFLNVLLIYIVFKFTSRIEKAIGDEGISIIQRIFGIILLAIAVKLFGSNVSGLL